MQDVGKRGMIKNLKFSLTYITAISQNCCSSAQKTEFSECHAECFLNFLFPSTKDLNPIHVFGGEFNTLGKMRFGNYVQ